MVRTRFAPSPTGDLHIGGVRTALYSWLYAKKHGGEFILRIEDTDRERSTDASIQIIIDGMRWLGLNWDGEITYQTQRYDIYNRIIDEMIEGGLAYYCYCSKEELEAMREEQLKNKEKPHYNGHCRHHSEPREGVTPVVRFKNPQEGEVSFNDLIRGRITISNHELDDFIIRRSDGNPTYNFCVVVDDAAMGISHVIRGDDHINNTPRQINLYRALGYPVPQFGHAPMILGPDGRRFSKRHGAASVLEYQKEGYLPQALLNYLVRLGWSHGDQEVFSMEEMIQYFALEDVHSAPSAFNFEKLRWLNQQYLQAAESETLLEGLNEQFAEMQIQPDRAVLLQALPHYRERAQTLKEMAENMRWLFAAPETYPEKAAKKAFKGENCAALLDALRTRLEELQDWTAEGIHAVIEKMVEERNIGFGKIGQPARLALTGGAPSPDLGVVFALLRPQDACQRLQHAAAYLRQNAAS